MTGEQKQLLAEWRELVNMSPSKLEKFLDQYGSEAGLSRAEAKSEGVRSGRDSARAILRMKAKSPSEWTQTDWQWAKRQVAFIRRMRGVKGPLFDERGEPTRKLLALRLWGHDPDMRPNANPISAMSAAQVERLPIGSLVWGAGMPLVVIPGGLTQVALLPERSGGEEPGGDPIEAWGDEFFLIAEGSGRLTTHGTAQAKVGNWWNSGGARMVTETEMNPNREPGDANPLPVDRPSTISHKGVTYEITPALIEVVTDSTGPRPIERLYVRLSPSAATDWGDLSYAVRRNGQFVGLLKYDSFEEHWEGYRKHKLRPAPEISPLPVTPSNRPETVVERLGQMSQNPDRLHGGVADAMSPSDFEPGALRKGTQHEMEHTDDPDIAREIAMDHLAEDEAYYERLDAMERQQLRNPSYEQILQDEGNHYPQAGHKSLGLDGRAWHFKRAQVHVAGDASDEQYAVADPTRSSAFDGWLVYPKSTGDPIGYVELENPREGVGYELYSARLVVGETSNGWRLSEVMPYEPLPLPHVLQQMPPQRQQLRNPGEDMAKKRGIERVFQKAGVTDAQYSWSFDRLQHAMGRGGHRAFRDVQSDYPWATYDHDTGTIWVTFPPAARGRGAGVVKKIDERAKYLRLPLRAMVNPNPEPTDFEPKYYLVMEDGRPYASFKNLADGMRELDRIAAMEPDLIPREEVPPGLLNWVEDYKKARHYGNVKLAKEIKVNIDKEIRRLHLDPYEVYGDAPEAQEHYRGLALKQRWLSAKMRENARDPVIYVDEQGRPIERPEREDFDSDLAFIEAFQDYKRRIENEASKAVYHKRPGRSHQRNASGDYWVWLLRKGTTEPLLSEGPYGPHDLTTAKQLARIGAQNGEHDRAVSRGRDPESKTFEIVRVYDAAR